MKSLLALYIAFSNDIGTGQAYVGKRGDDGAYREVAVCKDLATAIELAAALNDREDLRQSEVIE